MSRKAIQLMLTMVNEVESSSARMELTSAVFPVPGDPDIYNKEGPLDSPSEFGNADINSVISLRSSVRPDMGVVPFAIERSNARARTWIGVKEFGGVGGGVARVKWANDVAGVIG
jgi:hypothetical protein